MFRLTVTVPSAFAVTFETGAFLLRRLRPRDVNVADAARILCSVRGGVNATFRQK